VTHKDVISKPPSEVGFNEKKADDKWRVTGVFKGDAMGLHWLWKMTNEKRMSKLGNIGTVLQSQLRWAEIKLKDMDDKGWRRVAENLALNTGTKMITILGRNEFTHMNGCDFFFLNDKLNLMSDLEYTPNGEIYNRSEKKSYTSNQLSIPNTSLYPTLSSTILYVSEMSSPYYRIWVLLIYLSLHHHLSLGSGSSYPLPVRSDWT